FEKIHSLWCGGTDTFVDVIHSKGEDRIRLRDPTQLMDLGRGAQPGPPEPVAGPGNGFLYGASPRKKAIIIRSGFDKPVAELQVPGLSCPSGDAFSPGHGWLYVGDVEGKWIWSFRIDKDGKLSAGQPYCPLRLKRGE